MREKSIIPTDQFQSVIENGYKSINGFDKEVPNNMSLQQLVELMVAKYRTDGIISNEQMAKNIYSICVASLLSNDYAYSLIINKIGIDCQIYLDGESVYL